MEPLRPLPFHQEMRDALRVLEPGLFGWLGSATYDREREDALRLELLRSTYRLPRGGHAELYEVAAEVARTLGVERELTFYQASHDGPMNASLLTLGDALHVVLRGPVLRSLGPAELRALIGHELAHARLFEEDGGSYRTAMNLLDQVLRRRDAPPSYVASAVRFRRWTEVYADRGALLACGDPVPVIACLVKIETRLPDIDAAAYLAQAEEVVRAAPRGSEQPTHPESVLRAFAITRFHALGAAADAEIAAAIDGRRSMATLDLLEQRALERATQALVAHLLEPAWFRTESTLAHAARFFPEADVTRLGGAPLPEADGEGESSPSRYYAYVLLDFAVIDPQLGEAALAHALDVAARMGIEKELTQVARAELKVTLKSLDELRRRAPQLLADSARAHAQGES